MSAHSIKQVSWKGEHCLEVVFEDGTTRRIPTQLAVDCFTPVLVKGTVLCYNGEPIADAGEYYDKEVEC